MMTATEDTRPTEARVRRVIGGARQSLHVREWGRLDAPSVLLIHGWSGNHMCWRHQIESNLTEEFRLVALDLRGHGMSDCPSDPDQYGNPELWAADVAAVIDQCQLYRPVVVAWSYGGFIVSDYVRVYGEDGISAINFVGAAVTLNERFDDIGPAFLASAPGCADADVPTRIAALRSFWHSMTEQPLDLADFEAGLCGSAIVAPHVLGALISRRIDSDDVLARLGVPVLVTHGRQDQIILPSMAEHILRLCPTAHASWYDGVGHAPFAEEPGRFNRELAELTN